MREFTIKIKTENAAFTDEDGQYQVEPEVQRILKGIANQIGEENFTFLSALPKVLYDFNGNRVGEVDWKEV